MFGDNTLADAHVSQHDGGDDDSVEVDTEVTDTVAVETEVTDTAQVSQELEQEDDGMRTCF